MSTNQRQSGSSVCGERRSTDRVLRRLGQTGREQYRHAANTVASDFRTHMAGYCDSRTRQRAIERVIAVRCSDAILLQRLADV